MLLLSSEPFFQADEIPVRLRLLLNDKLIRTNSERCQPIRTGEPRLFDTTTSKLFRVEFREADLCKFSLKGFFDRGAFDGRSFADLGKPARSLSEDPSATVKAVSFSLRDSLSTRCSEFNSLSLCIPGELGKLGVQANPGEAPSLRGSLFSCQELRRAITGCGLNTIDEGLNLCKLCVECGADPLCIWQ